MGVVHQETAPNNHSYSSLPGNTDRGPRAKYALIKMGPSIFATTLTTILSAVIMLFCVITFFRKVCIDSLLHCPSSIHWLFHCLFDYSGLYWTVESDLSGRLVVGPVAEVESTEKTTPVDDDTRMIKLVTTPNMSNLMT